MEYRLTAELVPPEGTPQLDELQRYGVAALLEEWLERVATVEGPDGVEITPYDHEVDAHAQQAVVRLLVDAPALEFAENGAAALLYEILERSEHLAGWQVGKCAVTVTDAELAEAVSGEETPSVPGTRRHDDDLAVSNGEVPAEVRSEQQRRLLARATDLAAFAPQVFESRGERREVEARLAAGALIHCSGILTEELFADLNALEEVDTFGDPVELELTAADYDVMFVLHDLPARYRHLYGATFAKRFLVAAVTVFARLTEPSWIPPRCTAEALALHLLVQNAATLLIGQAGVAPETARAMLAEFANAAFRDHSHEALFWRGVATAASDGGTEPDSTESEQFGAQAERWVVVSWFQPDGETAAHPYYDLGESG